jgi:hypothetical protein
MKVEPDWRVLEAVPANEWQRRCQTVIRRQYCAQATGFVTRYWYKNRGTTVERETWVCEKHARSFAEKHGIEIRSLKDQAGWRVLATDFPEILKTMPGLERTLPDTRRCAFCDEPIGFRIVNLRTHSQTWVCEKHATSLAKRFGVEIESQEEQQMRRPRNRHSASVTINDLVRWVNTAVSPEGSRKYVRAKVDLKTDDGMITTWLGTDGIRSALALAQIIKCHEANFSRFNPEQGARWKQLRKQIVSLHGHRCMRCGTTEGKMDLDHIKPWSTHPKGRYDPANLQLLCRECHASKHKEVAVLRPR